MNSDRSGDESKYIHGVEPDEQERLTLLNGLLNARSVRALCLQPGERVLDVGSGLGQLSRAIGRQVRPDGIVIGIERDPAQIEEALLQARTAGEAPLVEFRQGLVEDLPLRPEEWGSFDVVHCRFVLEHLSAPAAAVEAMVAALRPGGRIVLEDDDHDLLRMSPPDPRLARLWEAYCGTYEYLGNDPRIGNRLTSLLCDAGALPVKNDMLFFGACAGSPTFEPMVANFRGIIEGAQHLLEEASEMSREEIDDAFAAFDDWSGRGDAALWYTTCWAEGCRPDRAISRPGTVAAREIDTTLESQGAIELHVHAAGPADVSRLADERPALFEFLADSASDLSSSVRLEDVFQKIARRIELLLDAHLFCIMLWNDTNQKLEHSYSLKYGQHVPQVGGFSLGEGISGSAAGKMAPIRVANVELDERYVRFRHAEVEIRSELAIPLIAAGKLVGVLDLESTELDAFTHEHEQVLVALGSHIASALENARLYETVRAGRRRLESDLARAREVQKALLPGALPDILGLEVGAGHSPALELSGDFYDVFPYPDGRWAFALGDVAGKGTGAALLGSVAVGMLRAHVLQHHNSPSRVLAHLNERLVELAIEHSFVAMLFGLYDPALGVLVVSNAGIPAPLFCHEDACSALDLPGLPLGGLSAPDYREIELRLHPGDLLVIASDGLEEAEDGASGRFGSEGVEGVVRRLAARPASTVAAGLIEASNHGIPGEGPGDDRTVLVLRAR